MLGHSTRKLSYFISLREFWIITCSLEIIRALLISYALNEKKKSYTSFSVCPILIKLLYNDAFINGYQMKNKSIKKKKKKKKKTTSGHRTLSWM